MRIALINIAFALSMILSIGTVSAQEYSVNCTVNQNPVPMGSRINLTVSFINCQPQNNSLERPNIPGLQYLGGPSISQQHQSVNFKSTSTYSYTYTYKVVSKADVKIPPVKVSTNRGVMNSDPFILKIVKRGSANKKGFGDVASVIEINKSRVHLGEPVLIQYKIYSRYSNIRYADEVPELQGFWKEVLPQNQNNRNVRQVNGIEYLEIVVKEVLAFPQQTGEFILDGFDVYGMITMGFFNQKEFQTQSNPVKITVVPLPEGKPNAFMGTFGRLDIKAGVDVDSVNVNEAFNYELTYSGKGNLKLIREPELDWPTEFEVFDPEIIDRINVTAAGESGKRTYKYAVIPRAPGTYELPKLDGSFFNHIKNEYKVVNADAGQITVKRDPNAVEGTTIYSHKSQVQVLNHDIRHISTDHGHWVAFKEGSGSALNIWILFLVGPAFAIWAFVAKRRNEAEDNDIIGTRHKKALRVCNKALTKCNDYTQLGETIEVYLCSKLGCGRSSFSRTSAAKILSEQLSEAEAKAWDELLKKCEMARFAPGALPEVQETVDEAKKLVKMSDMKILISRTAIVVWALLLPAFAICQTSHEDLDAQFEFANNAYLEGDYELAVATYKEISKEHKCFELEYNLGNCYYKLEDVGETMLHYERAKLIDPLNDDLRANMLLADLRVIDKIESLPGVGFERILGVLFAWKMLGRWLILSLITWTFGFILLAIRCNWKDSLLYPFASAGWVIMICISLVFSTLLYNTIDRVSTSACAVIMEDKVDVMSIPGETGLKLFHLHEGSRGCILSEEGEWTEIRLENGNVGWLPTAAIERI